MKAIHLICTTTIDIPMILQIENQGQGISIMRMRIETEKSFICLALGIATAGRNGINCKYLIIDK